MAVKATCHVYVLRCSLKDQTPMCKKELLMIALMSSPQCTGQAFNEDRRSTPRPLPMPTTDKRPSKCIRQAPRRAREAKS